MVPDGHLLFDRHAHDLYFARQGGTGALKASGLRARIEDFAAWANREAASQVLPGEAIPDDPHGAIGLGRFRRSLAWHTARRLNGLVRPGHPVRSHADRLRLRLDDLGHGSRSRGGIHDLINLETARATADTVMDLHETLSNGGGISGPAARRAIRAATTPLSFAGVAITLGSAGKLLKNEDAMIYDNPLLCDTHSGCVWSVERHLS